MQTRRIEKFHVFCFTCAASVLAYLWMLVVLAGITPDRVDLWEGVVTLSFFFVFLAVAFSLDKRFSSDDPDYDVVEVHRQLENRFGQPVNLEGVRAMLKMQPPQPEGRNSRLTAKGKLLRLSVGGKKQPNSYAYGFLVAEEVVTSGEAAVVLQIVAMNGPHPAPVRIKYRTRNGMAKAGKRYHQKSGVLHFLPEDDRQELRISMMDTQGPPEEFYVELTEIHAEGAEGKKNPPVLANSGCCLVWILSESDGVWTPPWTCHPHKEQRIRLASSTLPQYHVRAKQPLHRLCVTWTASNRRKPNKNTDLKPNLIIGLKPDHKLNQAAKSRMKPSAVGIGETRSLRRSFAMAAQQSKRRQQYSIG
ncbi:unnamed protein product [Effrenium voratum]|uniref:Calx-beta domain-containing protein n=1 Tax=Effrenium voratum TaxID=2562239 RepID=A0AA36J2U4_9DINO|nr:unnamed protein product [Effrenium voratum]